MYKIVLVALREYQALVRTKAFIISLVMMPVFMFGMFAVQSILAGRVDISEKKVLVLDGTGRLFAPLVALAEIHNQGSIDKDTGRQTGPMIRLEKGPDAPVTDDMRLGLSDRIRHNEVFAFVEIDEDALKLKNLSDPRPADASQKSEETSDDEKPTASNADGPPIRIYTDSVAHREVSNWLRQSLNQAASAIRLEEAGLNPAVVAAAIAPVHTAEVGLYSRATNGEVRKGVDADRSINFFLPFGLMLLMFMSVMIVGQPMLSSILEEKQQRIAEMLLGSASPFQIMMGKLLGNVGVALTIVAIYLAGGYALAVHYGYSHMLPLWLLVWFVAFEILACVLYGALFLAVGAACNDIKDAQTLLTPMMLILVLPMMVWFNVVQEPLGEFAKWASLFPPATPMLMLMRLAASSMVPAWQPVVGIVLVLATTVAAVFAAGRVFRIGLLAQGKAPKLIELARWVLRG
jgi:ABC-2 type transport system permease protein